VLTSPIFPFLYNRIVPLPLHIFLGLGNQLVNLLEQALTDDDDLADLAIFLGTCKATPSGIGGTTKRSAALTLNGGELKKIIQSPQFSVFIDNIDDEETKIYLHILLDSLCSLLPFLLSPTPMSHQQLATFTELVIFIGEVWHRNNDIVKPKIHMLFHCVDFAREQQGLGAYNESPIESSHHDVHLTFENHSNCGSKIVNKERKTLSDISQRRLSRIDSGRIRLPPSPRLCHMCGRPSAKYLNNNQPHQCIAPLQ
jgi:hypothetical protein